MTIPRDRAIEIIEDVCRVNYADAVRLLDALLAAGVGGGEKTSGAGTPNSLDTQGEVSTVSDTTPARGPEEAGADSDALKRARKVLDDCDKKRHYHKPYARTLAREVVRLHERAACPCQHTTPCEPGCTCVEPLSGVGCMRCCTYGSPGQRRKAAERIALAVDSPASPPASDSGKGDGRPDREALGRAAYETWCCAEGDSAIPWGWHADKLGKNWEAWRVVGERLYEMGRKDEAGRAEALETFVRTQVGRLRARRGQGYTPTNITLAALLDGEVTAALEDEARLDAEVEAEQAKRKETERDRDASLARAEAAEGSTERLRVALHRACERAESAEARVSELEALLADQRTQVVTLRDTYREQGAADMRERAARRIDGWRAWGRPQDLSAAVRALPLRPTAPTSDDGDEKEKTT